MTFDEAFEKVNMIEGWLGDADARVLFEYASQVQGKIVEIGPYMGRSTVLLAFASPKSDIITIDPFEYTRFYTHSAQEVENEFYKNTNSICSLTHIKQTSEEVGKTWKEPIDFLFVDGNHEYSAVVKDIHLFIPHLKKGAYALFHDFYLYNSSENFDPERQGVSKALHDCSNTLLFDPYKFSYTHKVPDHGCAIVTKL